MESGRRFVFGLCPANPLHPCLVRLRAGRHPGDGARPAATAIGVICIYSRSRILISSTEAVSRNNANSFLRFSLDSATVFPWLAMSSSGQSATNPSPTRSITAVNCLLITNSRNPDSKNQHGFNCMKEKHPGLPTIRAIPVLYMILCAVGSRFSPAFSVYPCFLRFYPRLSFATDHCLHGWTG